MASSSSLFWKLPLLCFLLYLPFADGIDQATASFFLGGRSKFHAPAWCLWVYRYGLLPGQLLWCASALALLLSFLPVHRFSWGKQNDESSLHMPCTSSTSHSSLRWPAAYLCLTLVVGSGLFGHAVLKQFWQRPRPKQVTLYGGGYPYCSLFSPYKGPADRHLRSLPSGHATMGFYFFALYFLGRRVRRRWVAWTGLVAGIVLGGLLTWARLAQGGHFVSDIVVSLLLMWMAAYWIDRLLAHRLEEQSSEGNGTV